jgi:nitrogen-specific signal transduction histidine kinase
LARNLVEYSKAKGEIHSHKIPLAVAQEKDNSVKDPLAPQASVSAPENLSTVTLNNRTFAYKFFDVVIKVGSERRIGLILKDVTEEKQLLDQLTRADKLSGLGTLAAGIAHELNNPLQSIMGFSEAIIKKRNPSKNDDYAKKIFDRSKHMASVILEMSGYVQSSDSDFVTEVDINEQIEAAVKISLMTSSKMRSKPWRVTERSTSPHSIITMLFRSGSRIPVLEFRGNTFQRFLTPSSPPKNRAQVRV